MRPSLAAVVLFAFPLLALADDKPLTVDEAAKKVNEKVTVQLQVKSTGQSRNQKLIFLNSETDHRDAKNFVILIDPKAEEKFTKAGILDVRNHYKNKTIRVTGAVSLYQNKPQIRVEEPGQIQIVENK